MISCLHTLVKYNRYLLRLEFHTIVKTRSTMIVKIAFVIFIQVILFNSFNFNDIDGFIFKKKKSSIEIQYQMAH